MLRYRLSLPWLMAHRALHLFGGASGGFRILLFHDVPRESFGVFEELVAYVKQAHGILSPQQAAAWVSGEGVAASSGRTPCLFSFDDGFASNFDLAKGVLADHGVAALFFVCPGLVGLEGDEQRRLTAANIFDGRLDVAEADNLRLMTWDEIAELKSMGHTIGAHGMTHRRLSGLQGEDLRREILESGDVLEDRLKCKIDWFAYAFGDIASISAEALEIISQNHRLCRSGVRGVNDGTVNPLALRADHVDLCAPMAYRKLVLEGGLDRRYAKPRKILASATPRQKP